MRRRIIFGLVVLLATAVVILFWLFRPAQATFGPAIALCPGPDQYGYTCESAGGVAYIDATHDTFLYLDDGTTTLTLPFPFTFYGTTYTQAIAGSNGILQFSGDPPNFINSCLNPQTATGVGDLVAPYWSDLDLTLAGFLEHETVGEAPNRIFVLEWDGVPPFGAEADDTVTFSIQLFEGSNDIVFLYEDVSTEVNGNGRLATVGLQSEAQGLALQFSCNQPSLADAAGLYWRHPAEPNPEIGLAAAPGTVGSPVPPTQAKGITAELLDALAQSGPAVLPRLQRHWLSQTPARASEWRWVDLAGNGRRDLVMLWRSTRQHPELTQLAILTPDEMGQMQLLWQQPLASRGSSPHSPALYDVVDVTGDGLADVVLVDALWGQMWVATAGSGTWALQPVPERCQGSLRLMDVAGSGHVTIVRDGCAAAAGRLVVGWDGRQFSLQK